MDLTDWILEFGQEGWIWWAKRLSGNDTTATNAHQAGPYTPKRIAFYLCPSLKNPNQLNPRVRFEAKIDSPCSAELAQRRPSFIWYNNKHHKPKRTRDETRLTGWGGATSPLLDAESTGSIAVFAFKKQSRQDATVCHVWVCQNPEQDSLIEDRIGPIEAGAGTLFSPLSGLVLLEPLEERESPCTLSLREIPETWLSAMPSGEEIISKTISLRPLPNVTVDQRLLRRRDCEYELFRSVESAFYGPRIREGFPRIEDFLALANTMLQSRKSRAGRSLELHAKALLEEEGFTASRDFDWQPETEEKKRPDFIFPSVSAYRDRNFPENRLRMLAVKTTCKDRWRQVLDEANRVPVKHLLTLQEGLSETQYRQMESSNLKLVVPKKLHDRYPRQIRSKLISVSDFLKELRQLNPSP